MHLHFFPSPCIDTEIMHRFIAFTFLLPRNDDADQIEIFFPAFYVGLSWLIGQLMRAQIFKF